MAVANLPDLSQIFGVHDAGPGNAHEPGLLDPAFDIRHPRYRKAWMKAADTLLKTGKPFEINTGAISRGYRTTPYPDGEICRYLLDHGAKLIFSSDAHSKDAIANQFSLLETAWPDPGECPF